MKAEVKDGQLLGYFDNEETEILPRNERFFIARVPMYKVDGRGYANKLIALRVVAKAELKEMAAQYAMDYEDKRKKEEPYARGLFLEGIRQFYQEMFPSRHRHFDFAARTKWINSRIEELKELVEWK